MQNGANVSINADNSGYYISSEADGTIVLTSSSTLTINKVGIWNGEYKTAVVVNSGCTFTSNYGYINSYFKCIINNGTTILNGGDYTSIENNGQLTIKPETSIDGDISNPNNTGIITYDGIGYSVKSYNIEKFYGMIESSNRTDVNSAFDKVFVAQVTATFTLYQDFTDLYFQFTPTNSKGVTIDLNGHTISFRGFDNIITINPGIHLTLTDSKGGGKITYNSNNVFKVNEGGFLTISGGTYDGGNRQSVTNRGTMTVTGGTIKSGPIYNYGTLYVFPGATITFVDNREGATTVNPVVATVTTGSSHDSSTSYYGSFTDAVSAANGSSNNATLTMYKDVIGLTSSLVLGSSAGVTLDLNGHTLSGSVNNGVVSVSNGKSLTVNDGTSSPGTITCSGNNAQAIANNGTLIVSKGNIRADDCCIASSGTLTVNGGTFTTGGTAISVSGGTFNLNTFNGFGNYIADGANDIYLATGCKVTFTDNGSYAAPTNKLKVNPYNANLSPVTSGYGQYVKDNQGNAIALASVMQHANAETYKFELVAGEVVGIGVIDDPVCYVIKTDGSYTLYEVNGLDGFNTEAKVVSQAINSHNAPVGSTLSLMKDITLTSDEHIDCYATGEGSVTFDLNGHTISSSSTDFPILYINSGNITITNLSGGNGAITHNGSIPAIRNYATLTVAGGSISGANTGIYNYNNSTLTINGGRFENSGIGIESFESNITMTTLPTFSGNDIDIDLSGDAFITFNSNITTAPDQLIKIDVGYYDYPFTIDYSTYCTGIHPTQMFQYVGNSSNSFVALNPVSREVERMLGLMDDSNNSSVISDWKGSKRNILLNGRTFYRNGDWNTLCLPFSMTATQIAASDLAGAEIKELDADNSGLDIDGLLTLTFTTAYDPTNVPSGSIVAGKPYIVRWNKNANLANIINPVFTGVTISVTEPTPVSFSNAKGSACQFVGQFSPFAINNANMNEIMMMGSGSTVGYSNSTRELKCFRAHFVIPTTGNPLARQIRIDFNDKATSLDESVRLKTDDSEGAWYGLDGQRLSAEPKQKGVYIHNGKKVIIK